MKVDQVILEQLDAALNGSGSSGPGKGNGEFAAVLDKALTGGSKENSKNSGMPKKGEYVAASENKVSMPIIDQKMPESENSYIDEADLEEKLELLMLSLLKSDQAALEEFTANKKQQGGNPVEEKLIAAINGDKISAEALKEELAAKIDQQVKQAGGLKVKDDAVAKKPEKAAIGVKGEVRGDLDLEAKKALAENDALLKEKAVKAKNADKSNEAAKKAEKEVAAKKDSPGKGPEKKVEFKGKASDLEAKKGESAVKKPKAFTEQSSEKKSDQKVARADNARQDTVVNPGRNENSRAEANTQRPQNVSPGQEQNIAQQSTVKGDEALQGSRVLNAQNANLRESVMQQLQGRMIYLRESGNNPAEMRVTLHPPELGEVTVRVFSAKGRLSASIIAETPLAREILESSITELRQRMNFVNIQFDQLDVSTAGKEFEGFGRPGDREGSGKAEFGEAEGENNGSAESELPPQQVPPDGSGSGIDFWA